MPDNYSMWEAYEARVEAAREKFPICSRCGERILDERIWDIDGELYHPESTRMTTFYNLNYQKRRYL